MRDEVAVMESHERQSAIEDGTNLLGSMSAIEGSRLRGFVSHLRPLIPSRFLNILGVQEPPATRECAIEHPRPAVSKREAALQRYGLRTLQQIVDSDFPETSPIVNHFLSPGETALLIARQKEGKSTLALQMAIDISRGDAFLDRYKTQQASVLYVDYENRPHRIKERGRDLARERGVDQIVFVAYDLISDRNVGLSGNSFDRLQEIVESISPGLLVVDPLRLAIEKDSSDERGAVEALDKVSRLRESNPQMAVLLVHHLKKAQDNLTTELRTDPRSWIERVYGSQALLAHAETIWGLEHDESGCVLGTVSRSEDSFVVGLEREPESQRFIISPDSVQIAGMTPALRAVWEQMPAEFSRTEALALGIPNSTLDRVIRYGRSVGLIVQDSATRRYRKAA